MFFSNILLISWWFRWFYHSIIHLNLLELIGNEKLVKKNNLKKKCVFISDFGTSVVVLMDLSCNNSPEFIGIDWKREIVENK